MLERPEEIRRAPRVVREHDRAVRVGGLRDRRYVLHLEGERARSFAKNGARVRLHQPRDACADQRIVVLDFHAVSRQLLFAKRARRRVDRIRNEQMIAGPYERAERRGDAGESRGHHRSAIAAFHLRDGFLQRERRRRAVAPVPHHFLSLGGPRLVAGEIGMNHRGSAKDRRIHHAVIAGGIASDARQQSVFFHGVHMMDSRRGQCVRSGASALSRAHPRARTLTYAQLRYPSGKPSLRGRRVFPARMVDA